MTEIKKSSDLLSGLPPSTKQYKYKGTHDLLNILKEADVVFDSDNSGATSQYVIIFGVDEQVFINDIIPSPENIVSKCIDAYSPSAQILLIKLTNKCLEQAHTGVLDTLLTKLTQMGDSRRALRATGLALVKAPSRSKGANQEFRPRQLPEGRAETWPSMVIESGYFESKEKLQLDAQWWLAESNGEVRAAVTVSVHRQQRRVDFQKWDYIGRQTRTDPERHVSVMRKQITVSKGEDEQTASVSDAPFVISFQDLFLRDPKENEGDVVLNEDDLRHIAETVWRYQNL